MKNSSAPACALIVSALVMAIPGASHAQKTISGDIHAMTFTPQAGPYTVEGDIIVPAGKKVEIPAGVVFLFKPFTGFRVNGTAVVTGTQDKHVVFTSIHDSKYNPTAAQLPNPFDWNGILIGEESRGSYFNNFRLSFSVYGIKSQSQNVVIQNGVFYQNGQFHFTVNDKIQAVVDKIPFSYEGAGSSIPKMAGDDRGSPKEGKREKKKREKKGPVAKQKKIVRFTCLGVGVAGCALGTVFAFRAGSEYNKRKDWDQSSFGTSAEGTAAFEQSETLQKQSTAGSAVSYAIGVLGLVGFGVTFAF